MSEAFPATALPVPLLSFPLMEKQVLGRMTVTPQTPKSMTSVPAGRRLLAARVQGDTPDVAINYTHTRGWEAAGIESSRTTGVSRERLLTGTAPNTPS